MPQVNWPDELSTGVATLDELHRELLDTMSDVASTENENFADCYTALAKKVDCAFIREEQWMEEIDSALLKTYREQHAKVLGALHNAHGKVLKGDFDLGRKIVGDLLPKWYVVHIATMDMVLAIAMQETHIQIPAGISHSSGIYID
jgi:hemerythrin